MDTATKTPMSTRRKWLMAVAWVALIAIMLTFCSRADPGQAFAAEPVRIAKGDIYAVTLSSNATPAAALAKARQFCASKEWCQVLGWKEGAPRAGAMPMVDREANALAFNYVLNQATSLDQATWTCSNWPAGANCAAPAPATASTE